MLFVGVTSTLRIDTPTASRLNVRDDREAPLFRDGTTARNTDFRKTERRIFLSGEAGRG
jgi:hypothetical protein